MDDVPWPAPDRRTVGIGMAGLALAATFPAAAAPPVRPRDPDAEALAEFRRAMIGGWTGEGVLAGEPYRDRYDFAPAARGRYVRADYRMFGMDGAEIWHDFGAYGLDPRSGRFFTKGFGSDGATTDSVLADHQPGAWRFEGRTDGSVEFSRYLFQLRSLGPDEMAATTQVLRGGRWEILFASRYRRAGA